MTNEIVQKENIMFKKILLIDLDGVLNEYCGNFNKDYIPSIKRGAKEFLEKLSINYEIQIFTTRNKLLVSKWIINNKLDKYISDISNVKNPAYLHIDDRCICFDGDFEKTVTKIKNFKVYWK